MQRNLCAVHCQLEPALRSLRVQARLVTTQALKRLLDCSLSYSLQGCEMVGHWQARLQTGASGGARLGRCISVAHSQSTPCSPPPPPPGPQPDWHSRNSPGFADGPTSGLRRGAQQMTALRSGVGALPSRPHDQHASPCRQRRQRPPCAAALSFHDSPATAQPRIDGQRGRQPDGTAGASAFPYGRSLRQAIDQDSRSVRVGSPPMQSTAEAQILACKMCPV